MTAQFSTVKSTTTGALGGDQYALNLNVPSGEKVSFSANASAPAVYLTSTTGEITKLADPNGGTTTSPLNPPNVAFDKLSAAGITVKSSAAGPDGSLYVLAKRDRHGGRSSRQRRQRRGVDEIR